jgi:photosystem II stability/assembly factor-like uncharacterized protein
MRVFNAREAMVRIVTAPRPPLQTAFYRTLDGGATWTSAPAPPNPFPAPPPVYFLDIKEGWLLQIPLAANTPRILFHTVDGGLSWSELAHLDTAYDVSFKDSSNGWLPQRSLAGSPALLFTRDGGRTWLPQILALPPGAVMGDPRPHAPRFLDSQLAAFRLSILSSASDPPVRNLDNFLYWTRDGGETWAAAGRPPLAKAGETDYGAVDSFLDGRRGWEGSATSLFKTDDGGTTWSSVTTSLPRRGFYFAQLAVLGDRVAWGQLSDFSKRDGHQPIFVLVRTTDGGAHWTEVKVPSLDG